jgi:hypothetical protein
MENASPFDASLIMFNVKIVVIMNGGCFHWCCGTSSPFLLITLVSFEEVPNEMQNRNNPSSFFLFYFFLRKTRKRWVFFRVLYIRERDGRRVWSLGAANHHRAAAQCPVLSLFRPVHTVFGLLTVIIANCPRQAPDNNSRLFTLPLPDIKLDELAVPSVGLFFKDLTKLIIDYY